MLNHGISTAGLFLVVGFLYNRRHTKEISQFGGLIKPAPILAGFYLLISLSSLAFPGTNGFVGELLILLGTAKGAIEWRLWYLIPALFGVLLGAAYLFWLYKRVMLGEITDSENSTIVDLSRCETGICAALAVMILWVGIYPMPFVKISEGSVSYVLSRLSAAPLDDINRLWVKEEITIR